MIQEAFLRLQIYYRRGIPVRQPKAFLTRTALRLSINARRDEHRDLWSSEEIEDLPLLDLEAMPEDVLAAEHLLKRMHQTLESISPQTRDFFYLNRVDGLSYAQIAKLHGVTAWRRGVIPMDRMPLKIAVAEMNRYSSIPLVIEGLDADGIQVSGVFKAGDSLEFAHALARSHGISSADSDDEIVLTSKK